MERGDLRRQLPKLADCIQRRLALAERECPGPIRRDHTPRLSVLGPVPFLCPGKYLPAARSGFELGRTPSDVRELIAYRIGQGRRIRHCWLVVGGQSRGRLFETCWPASWPSASAMQLRLSAGIEPTQREELH